MGTNISNKLLSVLERIGRKIFKTYCSHPIILSAVTALVLELYIESFSNHSLIEGFEFVFYHPLAYLFNSLILFACFAISFPLKRGIAAWVTSFSLWFIFGTANGIVLMNRPSPFTGSDFSLLPSVIEVFTKYLEIWQIILIIIGLVAVICALVFLWVKCPKRDVNLKRDLSAFGISVASTALATALSISLGIVATDYGNLLEAYFDSGFPYSFSRSVICHGINKPSGYSEAEVKAILDELETIDYPDVEPFDGEEAPDIIFVQLESFFDLSAIKGLTFSENPIPCFTELKQNYPSGFLHVPLTGSGTANTEFEVLTGMNIDYFSPGEYPFVAQFDEEGNTAQSIATVLSQYGYTSHSMHNNTGTFYNRDKVYPNFGFNSFTPVEYMYDVEYNELGWAKDSVLIDEIDKALASSEGSDFVFTVAVQPHGAYPTEQTGEYKIEVSNIPDQTEEKLHMYSYYVNQLKECDEFIRSLTEHYTKVDKNTVIIFYGDHLPDLKFEEEDLSRGDMYATEYIIWSNYGLGMNNAQPDKDLQSYQLSTHIFSLLHIEGGLMNQIHTLYSSGDADRYDEVMRLIEYDALYGNQYCYQGNVPIATDMRFGNTEISVESHSLENSVLTVRGKGFNKYSVIYVDGKRFDTVYNSDGTLTAKKVKDLTNLKICQEAPNGKVFK